MPGAQSGAVEALLATVLAASMATAAAQDAPVPHAAAAGSAVRCAVSYAGTVHAIAVAADTDPYAAEAVDIGGRFRFKVVVRGQGRQTEMVKVYVYQQTPRQPVLLHEARYAAPFSQAPLPGGFTGEHTVYALPLERQLHYACALP